MAISEAFRDAIQMGAGQVIVETDSQVASKSILGKSPVLSLLGFDWEMKSVEAEYEEY